MTKNTLRELVHSMMKDMLMVGATGADSLQMRERYMPIWLPKFEALILASTKEARQQILSMGLDGDYTLKPSKTGYI